MNDRKILPITLNGHWYYLKVFSWRGRHHAYDYLVLNEAINDRGSMRLSSDILQESITTHNLQRGLNKEWQISHSGTLGQSVHHE